MSSRKLDNFVFDLLYMCMMYVGFLGLLLLLFLGVCGWFPKFGKTNFLSFLGGIFFLHLRVVLVHA